MDSQRPHVLAIPLPAQGHINPMMLLCRKLASMGFVITFLTTRQQIVTRGDDDDDDDFRIVCVSDKWMPSERLGNNLQMFLNAMEGMRGEVEQTILDLNSDPRRPLVTCILCDAFIAWTQEVALKFGICRASLWTTSTSWALLCLRFSSLHSNGLLPVNGSNKIVDFVDGLPPFSARCLPDTIQVDDPDDPGFRLRIHRNEIMRHDAWVLLHSVNEIETSQLEELARSDNPNFVAIGPLHCLVESSRIIRSAWEQDRSCLQWLDEEAPRSVVYVSFGSLATVAYDQVEEILTGLDRSGYAFLWVLRLDLFESEEIRTNFLAKVERNAKALVVSWAPQLEVLQHESVGAFLTHCGWNSTMEGVSAGVPLICKPCFAEQVLNCALVVDHLQVGLRATEEEHGKDASASQVEKAVTFLMGDAGSDLRRRAKDLSDKVSKAVKVGGSSYSNLQAFAQDMKDRQLKLTMEKA